MTFAARALTLIKEGRGRVCYHCCVNGQFRPAQHEARMTYHFKILLTLAATAFLAACAHDNSYPVSGEACTPGDPVQGMEAAEMDCVPQVN